MKKNCLVYILICVVSFLIIYDILSNVVPHIGNILKPSVIEGATNSGSPMIATPWTGPGSGCMTSSILSGESGAGGQQLQPGGWTPCPSGSWCCDVPDYSATGNDCTALKGQCTKYPTNMWECKPDYTCSEETFNETDYAASVTPTPGASGVGALSFTSTGCNWSCVGPSEYLCDNETFTCSSVPYGTNGAHATLEKCSSSCAAEYLCNEEQNTCSSVAHGTKNAYDTMAKCTAQCAAVPCTPGSPACDTPESGS